MRFLGICHPPGFPLYVVTGKIFTTLFPFGSLIYKANLFSAIMAALSILLVYWSLLTLKVQRKIAFLVSLLLAVNIHFWEFAIAADVFTFATFLTALTFYLVFNNKAFWAFLTLGLLSSHFYISAVLFPFLAWYFWGFRPKLKPLFWAILFFSLGFFPQILMYIRMQQSPQINWGHAQGLAGFIDFVRRREFGSIFLLSNPVLTFSLIKLFKHFQLYLKEILTGFGIILPFFALTPLVLGKFTDRKVLLITFSFFIIMLVQLTLLSTIDPTGEDNPFQISKFYLLSYVLVVLLAGIGLDLIVKKIFNQETLYASLLLSFLVVIYFLANFKTHDFSKNYFSRNLVLDSLSQLPENSVVILVNHVVYFGGLYEQKVDQQFSGIKLLYFPNEKNRDGQTYQPTLFAQDIDQEFVRKIKSGKTLGKAEEYVLETIARNLDKPIFILQGTFEEGFFAYLKPYLRPYGLWWRVEVPEASGVSEVSKVKESDGLLGDLRNGQVKFDELNHKNQQLDLLTYAVSYHSTATALAAEGQYEAAVELLNKSYKVRPKGDNIQKEIELIEKTRSLENRTSELTARGDKDLLTELGNNYFTLGNYRKAAFVFEIIANFDSKDAKNFNNLASTYAALGRLDEAKSAYQRALELDPNLDLAKKGLEALDN